MRGEQYAFVVVLAIVAGFLGGIVAGRSFKSAIRTNGIIKAEKVLLVDGAGKVHTYFGPGPSDGYVLAFYDKNGKVRNALGATSEGTPYLSLNNEEEIRGIHIGFMAEDAPFLVINDKWGKPRLMLKHDESDSGFSLHNKEGKARAILSLDSEERSVLNFIDKDDRTRFNVITGAVTSELNMYHKNEEKAALIVVSEDGFSTLRFQDRDGDNRLAVGLFDTTAGVLLTDKNKKPRITLSYDNEGPSLIFVNEFGRPIWAAP